jgi:large subunit ribosomal protein L22
MKAYLKNYRQSPRKVRLVTDLISGKSVIKAMALLSFVPKRASLQILKVVKSAASNAEQNFKMDINDLVIQSITVDKGITLKRSQPRSRGMSTPIHKHTSNVSVILGIK